MNSQRDIRNILDDWLAEGPAEMSDRGLEAALDTIEHTRQRRVLRVPRWRNFAMTFPLRFASAAAIVAVVVIAGLFVIGQPQSRVGTNPTSSATSSTTPGPAATSTSEASPGPYSGATYLSGGPTAAGVTYYSDTFDAALTVQPGAGWFVDHNASTIVALERGTGSPSTNPTYVVQILIPDRVVLPGTAGPTSAPADLIGWLRGRPDLTMSAPASVKIGGIDGTMVSGRLRTGAALNPEGIVNLICQVQSNCGYEGGELIAVGPSRLIEFVVLDVRGNQVVIGLVGPAADTATTQATFDAFLATLAFPAP